MRIRIAGAGAQESRRRRLPPGAHAEALQHYLRAAELEPSSATTSTPASATSVLQGAQPGRGRGALAAGAGAESGQRTQGDLTDADAAELLVLKRQIQHTVGFHCDGYKEKCLRRRIAVRMRACGVHTYADYARAARAGSGRVRAARRHADDQRQQVLPQPGSLGRVATGAAGAGEDCDGTRDPHVERGHGERRGGVHAAIVHEHARRRGHRRPVPILGTDIDRESLASRSAPSTRTSP
jgi:hypothetical protein